ncbi:hypothetical protein CF326_g6327 [Tilletia indica]|nr:hypothetical protein CF326_g6327 [Tilletia indica]
MSEPEEMNIDPPEQPALEKKHPFNLPELLALILQNLRQNKGDLVNASLVSQQFRAVAQPILFREMSLPLSIVPRMIQAFRHRRSRARLQHIKALKLWDDEAYRTFRFEAHSQPKTGAMQPWRVRRKIRVQDQPDKEQFDPRWTQEVYEFLDLLTWSRRQPPPFIDLSFGVVSSLALHRLFLEFPECAQRVTAIRVVSDFPFAADGDIPAVWDHVNGPWWQSLANLLQGITQTQDRVNSSSLKVFSMECYGEALTRRTISPATWQMFHVTLASRIEELTLFLTETDRESEAYKALLRANWPRIRRFHLRTPSSFLPWTGWLESVEDFLHRHPQLVELYIDAPKSLPSLTLTQTFPHLERAIVHNNDIDVIKPFLTRHPELVELGFDAFDHQNDDDFLADVSQALPALQKIRARAVDLQGFLIRRLPISHIQGIVETAAESINRLRHLILALQSAKYLRAVHYEYMAARPLVKGTNANLELDLRPDQFPRSLEYISWHVPQLNRTEYYRVHEGSAPEAQPLDDVEVDIALKLVEKELKEPKIINASAPLVKFVTIFVTNLANVRTFESALISYLSIAKE